MPARAPVKTPFPFTGIKTMRSLVRRFTLAGLLLLTAGTAQAQVVVSQVYGGGGNTGAPVKSDFIELHNNGAGSVAVPAGGWSVQYASSTGTSWTRTDIPAGTTIPAGGYLLVREGQGAGAQTDPWAFDIVGNISMSGTAGKVALVNNQTTLSGTCPLGAAVLDFVGFGPIIQTLKELLLLKLILSNLSKLESMWIKSSQKQLPSFHELVLTTNCL